MLLKYQLFKNYLSTISWVGVTTIIGLIIPPILIARMGLDVYGIWALIVLLSSYISLLDFGFQTGMVKLIAEARAINELKRINIFVGITFWLYMIIFIIGCLFIIFFGKFVTGVLLVGIQNPQQYLSIVQAYTIVSLASLLSIPFISVVKGFQRYDLTNTLEIIALIINTMCLIILLINGYMLEALVFGSALAAIIRLFSFSLSAKKVFPDLSVIMFSKNDLSAIKKLIHLSPADISIRIYNAISQSFIRMSISVISGVSYVGVYDLAKRLVLQINGISSGIFIPMVPAVSALAAEGKSAQLLELLKRSFRYLIMIGLPFSIFFYLFYDPILAIWLNIPDVHEFSFAGRVLLVMVMAELLTGPLTTTAIGLGSTRMHLIYLGLSAILKFIFIIYFGRIAGFHGILYGELLATIISIIAAIISFQYWTKFPILKMISAPWLRVLCANLPIWLLVYIVWNFLPGSYIWDNLFSWIFIFTIGLLVILILYWIMKLVTPYEIDLIRKVLD